MKNKPIKYIIYIVLLVIASGLLFHYGQRWWAQYQVNQVLFKGIPKLHLSDLPAEWQKNAIDRAFVHAACRNDEKLTLNFLHAGYSPNTKTEDGLTPLHCVAGIGNLSLARELVSAGADMKALTAKDGLSPLHYAALFHRWDIVRYLVKEGASINEPSKYGTPVLIAANHELAWRLSFQMEPPHKTLSKVKESLATSISVFEALGANLGSKSADGRRAHCGFRSP